MWWLVLRYEVTRPCLICCSFFVLSLLLLHLTMDVLVGSSSRGDKALSHLLFLFVLSLLLLHLTMDVLVLRYEVTRPCLICCSFFVLSSLLFIRQWMWWLVLCYVVTRPCLICCSFFFLSSFPFHLSMDVMVGSSSQGDKALSHSFPFCIFFWFLFSCVSCYFLLPFSLVPSWIRVFHSALVCFLLRFLIN